VAEADDPRLAIVVGGESVGANLDRAIEAGAIVRGDDGRLSHPSGQGSAGVVGRNGGFIQKLGDYRPPCGFLNNFVFDHAYAEQAVPFGCRECFKIKVVSNNLRRLMDVKEIAEATGHTTKSGTEVDNPTNPHPYATYLYFRGLEEARNAYPGVRRSIDGRADLAPGVAITIKRGCSNYERKCGPSDQYTFDPRLEAVEAYLHQRFKKPDASPVNAETLDAMRMLRMVKTAYRIGDDTYRQFTGGQPLFPPVVAYPPEADAPAPQPSG
jgi:hypothetical protein